MALNARQTQLVGTFVSVLLLTACGGTAAPVSKASSPTAVHSAATLGGSTGVTCSSMTIVAGNGQTHFDGSGDPSGVAVPGPATSSPIAPAGLALDAAGNLYIADQDGYLEKVTPSGTLSIIGGTGNSTGGGTAIAPVKGPATASPLAPVGVTVDATGNVYESDLWGGVTKIDTVGQLSYIAGARLDLVDTGIPASANTPRVAGPALKSGMSPKGLALDAAGNLLIADGDGLDPVSPGTRWGYLMKVDRVGALSFVAGNGDASTSAQPAAGSALSSPLAAVGVATDPGGNIYIADDHGYIDKVNPSGTLSVIAGIGSDTTYWDGSPKDATQVSVHASGIATDTKGNLYIAEGGAMGMTVERLTPDGQITAIGSIDGSHGPASPVTSTANSLEKYLTSIAVDKAGNVYVGDDRGYVEKLTCS